jgi:purine-binding chemotaxis protein CheW
MLRGMDGELAAIAAEPLSLLIVTLADERYALPVDAVREVLRWRAPTPIPGAPLSVAGVLHHRGTVLPVIDARAMLGLPTPSETRATRLLVVEAGDIRAAIICDAVADITAIDAEAIESPASLSQAGAALVRGVLFDSGRPVTILEPAAIRAALDSRQHVHA